MAIRAAVMTEPRKPVEIWTLDDPELEHGSLLLETVASEVCGTDVHLHEGRLDGVPYPIIPGHVSVGRVVERRGVETDALGAPLREGDAVTFYDVHEVCNRCYHCMVAKQPTRCPNRRVYGITYSVRDGPLGGWAEHIYLKPGVKTLKLPPELSPDDVIGGGCGLFTGFAAVDRGQFHEGSTTVIQGAGPVGLSAAAFASLGGATEVVVIGAPAARLKLATQLGATTVLSLDLSADERLAAVREMTEGRGADAVIEASGNPQAIVQGLDMLRDGGTYVVAGHYADTGSIEINPHIHINRRHASILGQWGTEFRHVVNALKALAAHHDRLPFDRVIGGRYGLEGVNQALADVAALRVTKAIIRPRRTA